MSDHVLVSKDEGVMTVTLNRQRIGLLMAGIDDGEACRLE